MKGAEIKVGGLYTARISGNFVTVRVDSIGERMGFKRMETIYNITNLKTGRKTTFRSAAKFRSEVKGETLSPFAPAPIAEVPSPKPVPVNSCTAESAIPTTSAKPTLQGGEYSSDPTRPLSGARTVSLAPEVESPAPTKPTLSARLQASRGQQPVKAGHTPTPEQQAILDATIGLGAGDVLVIGAGAGTGKTSTLVMLEGILPGRGQYTAFNASLVAESGKKFSKAQANTTHSLAFRAVGKNYAHRLGQARVRSDRVAEMLGLQDLEISYTKPDATPGTHRLNAGFLAGQVTAALRRFCQSADKEITEHHFRYLDGLDTPNADGQRVYTNNKTVREYLLPFAQKAWADIVNPEGQLPFNHDFYMKIWELNNPVISAEYILIDECQDVVPCVLSILKQQKSLLILVGDDAQCQPSGTMVTVVRSYRRGNRFTGHVPTSYEQIPIEEVRPGDQVASYSVPNSFFRRTGNKVTKVAAKPFRGDLIRVALPSGKESLYTYSHKCVVRVGDALNNKWVVYLMQKGVSFRVGMVKGMYESQNGDLGLAKRMRAEGADAAWVLDTYESEAEARRAEAITAWAYGIPSLRFLNKMKYGMSQADLDVFWSTIGNLIDQADTVLRAYHRSPLYPLCSKTTSVFRNRGGLIKACNLLDGMLMLPMSGALEANGKRAAKNRWEVIKVSREKYSGTVHSLEVARDGTYVADGIITHNSIYEWRGAIDAMKAYPDAKRLFLSQSFRFGEAIASVANQVLAQVGTELRLKGLPSIPSRVEACHSPKAILCRTNACAVGKVLGAIEEGKKPFLVGGGSEVVAFVEAAQKLQNGESTSHPELACFGSWAEVEIYSKLDDGEDLRLWVRLINEFGCGPILAALRSMTTEENADVVICTAHKSKGREWDSVKLAADFPTLSKACEADLKLLYVAVTRAKLILDITECPFFTGEDALEIIPHRPTTEGTVALPPTPAVPPVTQGFSWSKGKDGSWLVRGPKGYAGQTVEVTKRDGSTSSVRLGAIKAEYEEAVVYQKA